MRHLLQALVAMLSAVLLLFVGATDAGSEDPTLEEDLVAACEEAGGRMQDGICYVHPGSWCGFPDSPSLCDDERFGGRWMADPGLLGEVVAESAESEPVAPAEPATPTPGVPAYTG